MELKYIWLSMLIICALISCSEEKRKGKKKKKLKAKEESGGGGRRKGVQECALFRDPNLMYVKENEPSYIKLDQYDFTGDLDISFWVLPDKTFHDGPIFNVGSEDNFKYYEWKTKAVNTQFLVVEITYSAVSMLTKVLKEKHLHQMELYTTYPTPYNLINGYWAHISAYRKNAIWTLSLNDTVVSSEPVQNLTDVNIYGRTAFLGGRPGYQDNVFRGIVKDLRVNGDLVSLKGREMFGNAEVRDCDSKEVEDFAKDLVGTYENEIEYGEYQADQPPLYFFENGYWYRYGDYVEDKKDKWEELKNRKKGSGRGSIFEYSSNTGTDDDTGWGSVYGLPF